MAPGFAARLLDWFRRTRRDLPWRKTRDPYRIWVSEVMLQQTRAAVVVPYYEKFLKRFGNIRALARARESELLRLWSGLGYYSRARNLRRAAQRIMSVWGDGLPRSAHDWTTLPGVGPYTAAAVASIAFGEPVAVLDGNVARVVARLTAHRGDIRSSRVREELRQRAQRMLDCRFPGEFNQALMELGATVCLPGNPRCHACPVTSWCKARRLGIQSQLPVKLGVRAAVRRELVLAVAERNKRILLRRRPERASLMPGFWELPEVDGPRLRLARRLGEFRHSITHHQYRVEVYAATLDGRPPAGHRWLTLRELARLPLTTMTRKALKVGSGEAEGRWPRPKPS